MVDGGEGSAIDTKMNPSVVTCFMSGGIAAPPTWASSPISLEITTSFREKYKPRPYGRDQSFGRLPPGGADVMRLCKLADDL